MITREQLEKAFEEKRPFKNKGVDHDLIAITLLRQRIPYDVCRGIIGGAEHDILYLVDTEKAIPYLTKEDTDVLADCNCWLDEECDCIALFV